MIRWSDLSFDSARDFALQLGQLQQRIRATVQGIEAPQINTRLIEDVALVSASTTLVQHKLGREIRGWRLNKQTANAVVWEDETSTADRSLYLPLACSANVTCSIEVY